MIQLAANLSLLFTEHPFLERFVAAAEAGFHAVETQFPYAWPAEHQARELQRLGLQQVLINLPAGDWDKGERGIACHPDRVEEFRAGVERAIEYAQILGCTRINCLAGIQPQNVSDKQAEGVMISNLAYAAGQLETAGIELVIEAINTHDIPGFFLNSTAQAAALIDRVGASNLGIQYDIYHMQMMGEDTAAVLHSHRDLIKHIQIADAPGRHEPGSGQIDYAGLFALIERIGYQGWVSCEYLPARDTLSGLEWLQRFGLKL
ncbi:hydroxypyruvate isomerase [Marinobacterium zhoushanense]|uniref:Hydroxypyruvate isomerase n=1 Tax=Marinobacterium zhoushanense TaxID=1679163 RepID=A0ABQ1KP67_9GAMM|nr:hydroxypyruvate isomerase [Marinobacterium zhoushanense]GGC06524.1 hydroxypyruvate isomerase [Marinobacterium zhoushanense]